MKSKLCLCYNILLYIIISTTLYDPSHRKRHHMIGGKAVLHMSSAGFTYIDV